MDHGSSFCVSLFSLTAASRSSSSARSSASCFFLSAILLSRSCLGSGSSQNVVFLRVGRRVTIKFVIMSRSFLIDDNSCGAPAVIVSSDDQVDAYRLGKVLGEKQERRVLDDATRFQKLVPLNNGEC